MQNKIQKAWKDKWKIIKGMWNSIFGTSTIKKIAKERLSICQSNKCGYYDKQGKSDKVFVPGEPACGICGCNLKFLTASMESKCSLAELGKDPLWLAQS